MHDLFLYSIVFSLGLVSFITCFAAEFKRSKKEDIRWDRERNCYIPESHAFGLGTAAVLCFCLAQIIGNIIVYRNHRTRIKREDGYKIIDLPLPAVLLLISWSNFVVVVLILSTAISMSRVQAYGEGWLEEDCYLVKDGVFAASGCLAILGLGGLTISANRIKLQKKKQQQLVQVVIKDQEKRRSIEEEQNHYEHQTKKSSETVIHLVEETSSTTNISRI
ncbi:Protein MODIFYING WALL LIGNIN-2 [Cardamine amara subsp. amara]|uniref:Protein MODIFYING WALL LIGNIN-2 n=1 Tax=Cardamine amara subsp. amara TaxID=228776 RepID=A0ABD1C5H4_CARAN